VCERERERKKGREGGGRRFGNIKALNGRMGKGDIAVCYPIGDVFLIFLFILLLPFLPFVFFLFFFYSMERHPTG
jgi:hypothetical protein